MTVSQTDDTPTGEPVAVVVLSPLRERLQLAGSVAAVAAVSGRRVRVFVSMNALSCFRLASDDAVVAEGPIGLRLARDGPPFLQLFADAVELGDSRVHPCSMAMEMLAIPQANLPAWFDAPLGMIRFLEDVHGSQVWTF